MTEEIPREQESGPGLRAIELGMAFSEQDWLNFTHHQISEQRVRPQDGEENHQPDEEFLGVELHLSSSTSLSTVKICQLLLLVFVVHFLLFVLFVDRHVMSGVTARQEAKLGNS